ncbi:major facilitator superfamily transporter [Thozetella sp. PMI_491]|nr:major facilitator superfamily transporter [Thozetella sp. PMI_491]
MQNFEAVRNDVLAHISNPQSCDGSRARIGNGTGTKSHGTVRLLENGDIVLIPTPSPDPKDPLNLPTWHKYLIIFIMAIFCAFSVLITSGLGSVYPVIMATYPNDDPARISDLLTYPTLFMGLGNLFSMPLAVAVGRRPVFLFSLVLLVASGIWCACATSLQSHIAGRDVYSLAAGQSEALAPFIIEEIHFLHERSAKLSLTIAVQTAITAAMFIATTYIVPDLGLSWWYGIVTIVNGVVLVLAFLFVVESRYDRPEDADSGAVHLKVDENGQLDDQGKGEVVFRVTTKQAHVLDPAKYGPRTWRHDLRILHFKPNWKATISFYKDAALGLALPNIFWMLLINGTFLGVYIYMASTFATILMSPPYLFKTDWLGYVQLGQVLDCLLLVPLGYGSDWVVKWMSGRNDGVHQPEYRLLTFGVPAVSAVIACTIYGRAGAHPDDWPWMAVVAPYTLGFFAFLGANLVGITYVIDCFPQKAGPLLLVICAGRGFISFGLSYSTVPLIALTGYDGALNIFAALCGSFSALGIAVYLLGGRIRLWATKRFWPTLEE